MSRDTIGLVLPDFGNPVVPPPITDVVAPLGPNARAMLKERRSFPSAADNGGSAPHTEAARGGEAAITRIRIAPEAMSLFAPLAPCAECRRPLPVPFEDNYQHWAGCSVAAREWAEGKRIANAIINKQPSPRPTVANLLRDARELIARRRDPAYGSLQITDAQIDELARAWVQNLMSNYVVAGME